MIINIKMDKTDKMPICLAVESLETPVLRLDVVSFFSQTGAGHYKGEPLKLTCSTEHVWEEYWLLGGPLWRSLGRDSFYLIAVACSAYSGPQLIQSYDWNVFLYLCSVSCQNLLKVKSYSVYHVCFRTHSPGNYPQLTGACASLLSKPYILSYSGTDGYGWGCSLAGIRSSRQALTIPRSLWNVRCCLWISLSAAFKPWNLEACLLEHLTRY